MKRKFRLNKKGKVLVGILCGVLTLSLVGVGYLLFLNQTPSEVLTMPNFLRKDVKEVREWIKDNDIPIFQYSITYEFDDTIEKDKVISQQPTVGTKIDKGVKIKIVVSKGKEEKEIRVASFIDKKKDEIEKVLKENGFTDYTFKYEDNEEFEKDVFIRIEPESAIITNDMKVTIYLSNGPKKEEKEKEENKKPQTEYVTVSSKSGISVASLEEYLNERGLTLGRKYSEYSDKIAKGYVIRNESGTYAKGYGIDYTTSLGKFSIDASAQNGKTKSEVDAIIKEANNKNAGWSFATGSEYNSDVAKGKLYGCKVSNKTLTCTVSKGPKPDEISVSSFANKSENELINYLADNGLKGNKSEAYSDTVAAGNIISNDTGNFVKGDTVNYTVSLGSNKKTITDAQVAALSNCVEVNNPNGTLNNVMSYIMNNLGFAAPNIVLENNDKIAGEIISSDLRAGSFDADTVFTVRISKGPAN